MNQRLEPIPFMCECGTDLRIANGWTVFRCASCSKVWAEASTKKSANLEGFSNENAGIVQETRV